MLLPEGDESFLFFPSTQGIHQSVTLIAAI